MRGSSKPRVTDYRIPHISIGVIGTIYFNLVYNCLIRKSCIIYISTNLLNEFYSTIIVFIEHIAYFEHCVVIISEHMYLLNIQIVQNTY